MSVSPVRVTTALFDLLAPRREPSPPRGDHRGREPKRPNRGPSPDLAPMRAGPSGVARQPLMEVKTWLPALGPRKPSAGRSQPPQGKHPKTLSNKPKRPQAHDGPSTSKGKRSTSPVHVADTLPQSPSSQRTKSRSPSPQVIANARPDLGSKPWKDTEIRIALVDGVTPLEKDVWQFIEPSIQQVHGLMMEQLLLSNKSEKDWASLSLQRRYYDEQLKCGVIELQESTKICSFRDVMTGCLRVQPQVQLVIRTDQRDPVITTFVPNSFKGCTLDRYDRYWSGEMKSYRKTVLRTPPLKRCQEVMCSPSPHVRLSWNICFIPISTCHTRMTVRSSAELSPGVCLQEESPASPATLRWPWKLLA